MIKVLENEICNCCNEITDFNIDESASLYREAVCIKCGSSVRHSDLIGCLKDIFGSSKTENRLNLAEYLVGTRILNLSSVGIVHDLLKGLPDYYCGEFCDGVQSGQKFDGVMCIDLQNIPFECNFFDLIITEDVLEHVEQLDIALREINRVLKIGGLHVFTVPVHEKMLTESRKYNPNRVYHGDPFRKEGSLVYTDFGRDVSDIMKQYGMQSEVLVKHQFVVPEDISYIDAEYERYKIACSDLLRVFRYNSIVFTACKKTNIRKRLVEEVRYSVNLDSTGERFVPETMSGKIVLEHMQRYFAVRDIIKGQKVLDAACGAGYGTAYMSGFADSIIGIDVSNEAIEYDRKKYGHLPNVQFIKASITDLPLPDDSIDVVVSFETIEHVDEASQNQFMKEIKRVLKTDGILIMSTPDKKYYSDRDMFKNEFHIKEFYFAEYRAFLEANFRYVGLFSQVVDDFYAGLIKRRNDKKDYQINVIDNVYKNEAFPYLIAVASDNKTAAMADISSIMKGIKFMPILYIEQNDVYSGENMLLPELKQNEDIYTARFDLTSCRNCKRVRIDPLEGQPCRISLLRLCTDVLNYRIIPLNADECRFNDYVFYHIDPIIEIIGDFEEASYIEFVYKMEVISPEQSYRKYRDKIGRLEQDIGQLQDEIKLVKNDKELINYKYNEIINSDSWRLTKPCRRLAYYFKNFMSRSWVLKLLLKGIISLKNNGVLITFNKAKYRLKVYSNLRFIVKNQDEKVCPNGYYSFYQEEEIYSDKPDVKVVAFYLPQFHCFPENDK